MRLSCTSAVALLVGCGPPPPAPPTPGSLASFAANSVLLAQFEGGPSGQTISVELFLAPAGSANSGLRSLCAPFDRALAATFNGASMELQAQAEGDCFPDFLLQGANLGIGGTVVLSDSTATWTATIQPVAVPTRVAWITPSSGVLRAGDTVQVEVTPAPTSVVQLDLHPANPSQLVVINPMVVALVGNSDGGEPFLSTYVEIFDGGFCTDAGASQVDFTLPSGAGLSPGPATLTIDANVGLPASSTGPTCQASWDDVFSLPATIEP